MTAATPGQAACVAWNAHYADEHGIEARNEWAASDPRGRAAWEAAAQAAIDAATEGTIRALGFTLADIGRFLEAEVAAQPPQPAPDAGAAEMRAARERVIARLAAAFGPHKAAVSRKPDEDHRHPWTEFIPDDDDERNSTLIVFRDTDGCNSIRPLTYGEIADALCDPPAIAAQQPQPAPELAVAAYHAGHSPWDEAREQRDSCGKVITCMRSEARTAAARGRPDVAVAYRLCASLVAEAVGLKDPAEATTEPRVNP